MYKIAYNNIFVNNFLALKKFYFISTVNLSNGIENRLCFSYNLVERSDFVDKFTFGNRLYDLRTQNNLTQKQLAMYLGVSNKAVSKWETGEAMPRVKTLQAIAQCFGITYSDLLSEAPNEEKLPPYEVYYRNKIEAKEDKFVNEAKFMPVFFAFFAIVKTLLCLFNIVFIKVNTLYSVFSIALLILLGVFYHKFFTGLIKNIKTVNSKALSNHFYYWTVFILCAVLDSIVFYKYDFNNNNTIGLHIISLAFALLFYIIQKKDCSEYLLQLVSILGIGLPLLFLGMWVANGTSSMYNYIENLMLLNEKFDNNKIYDVFVGYFVLFLNIISMGIYGHINIEFLNLSDIVRTKQIKTKYNDDKDNKFAKILAFVSVIVVSCVMIWIFFLLFKFLDLF